MFAALILPLKLLIAPLAAILGHSILREPTNSPISYLSFHLRHEHAVTNDSRTIFFDVPQTDSLLSSPYVVKHKPVRTYKPPSFAWISSQRRYGLRNESDLWVQAEVPGPDTESRETLLMLAKMTSNAYYEKEDEKHKYWYDLGSKWNTSFPFGWEPDADGFRGHIFVSDDNSTVVLSIKGTSAGWLAGDNGPTVKKDQYNDNLLFSCCCARVGPTWYTVCDCYSGSGKCDINCLQKALVDDSLFYSVATNLYNNATYMYPDANIWITGHSLGGALASLLGATFGVPVVAFEAPGEKMAASRLHLPSPPSLHHITHVYNTADPIPFGACTGVTSICALGGYALESRCHLGKVIEYDTVTNWGWAVDVRKHGIRAVVDEVLSQEWEPATKAGREVPEAFVQDDCVDCYNWDFGDYKDKKLEACSL